ncbi:MAG: diacylglycerol kinase [Gemmatimonadaceae bacterium 4484_173]|nr:MAG: diacylglycerol kinase [Gemmatimonadaceae bacterium 4484_173]RKZ04811.1 MAG: diacylglycerol kinase family protein [Candidatus Fermentibacteria bacterium]
MVGKQLDSFKHAFRGLVVLVKTQRNGRIHLVSTIVVIALGFVLDITTVHWAIISLAIGAVWAAEAINTGLEFLADRVAPEWHELTGKAKDVAAGGVLAASISAAATGFLIFLPYIL